MSLAMQSCPQCTGVMRAPAIDAIVCPHCGAIAATDAAGNLIKPTSAELDLLLMRPEIRKVIEQASAIRQALFGGAFTLADPTGLLEPESHPTLDAAIARAHAQPWPSTVWIVIDPSGHTAAHRTRRKDATA